MFSRPSLTRLTVTPLGQISMHSCMSALAYKAACTHVIAYNITTICQYLNGNTNQYITFYMT